MATIRIDEKLKELIEKNIKKDNFRWKYQNSKGFVDNAVLILLKKEKVIKNDF